jgi:hypothetical protein
MTTSSIEDRYCRCILKVSASYPKYNPYAVCTSSVYGRGGRKSVIHCSERYKYEAYTTPQLRGYAKLKKLVGAETASRKKLIKMLYDYVASIGKSKDVWHEYVREYRKDHPKTPYQEAVKKSSKEYRMIKGTS